MQFWSDGTVGAQGGWAYALEPTLDLCDRMGFMVAAGNLS